MTRSDQQYWDNRYADLSRTRRTSPQPLLVRWAPAPVPGSRALELACGLGFNALWLAAAGYTVDAIDISQTALRRARAEMIARGVEGVNFIMADLDSFPLPCYAYDLVYVFRFLDRRLFPAIRERVRPGGIVIYATLNVCQRVRPTCSPEHMIRLGELPGFFPGWDVLETSDDSELSFFVGRRPLS